jgi:DNA-binding transcriptional regulator WhiA
MTTTTGQPMMPGRYALAITSKNNKLKKRINRRTKKLNKQTKKHEDKAKLIKTVYIKNPKKI